MMSTQPHPKKKHHSALRSAGVILIALLTIVNAYQLFALSAIVQRVDSYNQGAVDEMGQVRRNIAGFAADINEMREILALPPREYDFLNSAEESAEDEGQPAGVEGAVYQFMSQLLESESAKKKLAEAEALYQQLVKDLPKEAEQKGFLLSPLEPTDEHFVLVATRPQGAPVLRILIEKKTVKTFLLSIEGLQEITPSQTEYAADVLRIVEEKIPNTEQTLARVEKQQESIIALQQAQELLASLQAKKITFPALPEDVEDKYQYRLENMAREPLETVDIRKKDGKILFQNEEYETAEDLKPKLAAFLQNVDASSSEEKILRQRQEELENIFRQKTFQSLLEANNYTLATPRSEQNKVVYEVKNAAGATVFSFLIEISSGRYKILKDGQEIYLFEDSKKKL